MNAHQQLTGYAVDDEATTTTLTSSPEDGHNAHTTVTPARTGSANITDQQKNLMQAILAQHQDFKVMLAYGHGPEVIHDQVKYCAAQIRGQPEADATSGRSKQAHGRS
jgi:hypothetical protein